MFSFAFMSAIDLPSPNEAPYKNDILKILLPKIRYPKVDEIKAPLNIFLADWYRNIFSSINYDKNIVEY